MTANGFVFWEKLNKTSPLVSRLASKYILKVQKSVVVAPRHGMDVTVKIPQNFGRHSMAVIEPLTTRNSRHKVEIVSAIVKPEREYTVCKIWNNSDTPFVIKENQPIASIMPASIIKGPISEKQKFRVVQSCDTVNAVSNSELDEIKPKNSLILRLKPTKKSI